jgi:hypothetical protein
LLNSVSCTSPSTCIAVGWTTYVNTANIQAYRTLIESWDGTSWSITSSRNRYQTSDDQLNSVTCISNGCTAAGVSSYTRGAPSSPLIESD